MRLHSMFRGYVLCGPLMLGLVACGDVKESQEGYQEIWDETPPLSIGKPDLLGDLATPLDLGQQVSGRINKAGNQGDRQVYLLQLQVGDRIKMVMEGKSTLQPDFVVYRGAGEKIHSQSWDVTDQTLTKEYVAADAGRFPVLVRAYQGQGRGNYTLIATCLGGPCNGEFPDPAALEMNDAAECIGAARDCSFSKMKADGVPLTAAQAATLYDDCLEGASYGPGYSCRSACGFIDTEDTYYPNGAAELCKEIKAALVFYSSKSEACFGLLDECLYTCDDYGHNWSDEFAWTEVYACFSGGFNGNCNSYARDHEFCGGTEYIDETWHQCCGFVEATDGVWSDDMDSMCADSCGDYEDE